MGSLLRRLSYLFHRSRRAAELQNDLEFHREMAANAGHNNFGNVLRIREQSHEAWGWTWLERLMQDLQFGGRILARSPGFTLMAVAVLAIGIGVNAAAFSLFDMVALKLMPVRDAASLVRLQRRSPTNNTDAMPYTSFLFYQQNAKSLSGVVAALGTPPVQFEDDVKPASFSFFTANYYTELGTRPAFGRLFTPAQDGSPNDAPSLVMSYGFWQRRFGGDASVIGRVVHINKKPVTVIGVLPEVYAGFSGQGPEIIMPMAQQPYMFEGSRILEDPTVSSVKVWGRLAPGVTRAAAAQELVALTNQIRKQYPKEIWEKEFIQVDASGHMQVMSADMWRVAFMVGVLTLLILAVACANLGGLLLARAVTRTHEIGIRIAIGAGRTRIFRQLCTESLLLASLGSLVGLALQCVLLRLALNKLDAPHWLSPLPDWRVLLVTVGVTFLAAIFFGLAPALQIARQRQQRTFARQALITAQIAASCILLIVAGLLVRATQHALYTSPGFGYEQVMSIDPQLGRHGYTPASAKAYFDQMESRLRNLPGVRSVSLVSLPPMGHAVDRFRMEDHGRVVEVYPNSVTPDFFATMEIPLLAGRAFNPGEQHTVIVSELFARKQFLGENPLGKTIDNGNSKDTVIGVAGNAHINAVSDNDATEEYWAAQPSDLVNMTLMVRTTGAVDSLPAVVLSMSESLDARVFPEIRPLKALYNERMQTIEWVAGSVSLIGIVAISLAGIGIIGLVAFTVSQRTKEIAIRLALGANHVQVLAPVLRQFLWPIIVGMAIGTGIAAACTKLLRFFLFGIDNLDPLGFAGAIAVLALVVAIAALWPARKALRLNVSKALHCE